MGIILKAPLGIKDKVKHEVIITRYTILKFKYKLRLAGARRAVRIVR